VRCQLSVKFSEKRDVPIIVAAVVVRLAWAPHCRCSALSTQRSMLSLYVTLLFLFRPTTTTPLCCGLSSDGPDPATCDYATTT
jgi:hypothetical protein